MPTVENIRARITTQLAASGQTGLAVAAHLPPRRG
jgi:hypothetical protein